VYRVHDHRQTQTDRVSKQNKHINKAYIFIR